MARDLRDDLEVVDVDDDDFDLDDDAIGGFVHASGGGRDGDAASRQPCRRCTGPACSNSGPRAAEYPLPADFPVAAPLDKVPASTGASSITLLDIQRDRLTGVATEHWGAPAAATAFHAGLVREIYATELRVEGRGRKTVPLHRVMILEVSQYLENYLWPNFDPDSASFEHVMSMILMVNEKFRENVAAWTCFHDRKDAFSGFLWRVIKLKEEDRDLNMAEKTNYLLFMINAFQSLEDELVRETILQLVSLKLWHTLSFGRLQMELCLNPELIKKWTKIKRREEAKKAGQTCDASEMLENKFLKNLIEEFLEILDSKVILPVNMAVMFLRPLVADVAVVAKCHLSALYTHEKGRLFAQLVDLLQFYEGFEINDHSGTQLSDDDVLQAHYSRFQAFHLLAFKQVPKLRDFSLCNIASIHKRADLAKKLLVLSDVELQDLVCNKLKLISEKDPCSGRRDFLIEVLVAFFEKRQSQKDAVNALPLYPNEQIIISSYKPQIKSEWDALKEHDVLFLLSIRPSFEPLSPEEAAKSTVPERLGLQYVRGCEVIEIRDEESSLMNDFTGRIKREEWKPPKGEIRTVKIALDTAQYHIDVTEWTNMPDLLETIDFKDTFVDADHVIQSFPDYQVTFINSDGTENLNPSPPFKIKKKKFVETYIPGDPGPYPQDKPKQNSVRFTPTQIGAIVSGIQPGLTMVVGPPGTGKTDTAVQILNVLYHNCPSQRTLIITHSNQALNDLFEKIMQRDVPARYLLRLGQGEQELATDLDFSRQGRVNAMLVRRLELLGEVAKLARSLHLPEDVSYTCETAAYFWLLHVYARWEQFLAACAQNQESPSFVKDRFPFSEFFSDTPQPIFTAERANYLMTKQAKVVAMTCTHAALKRRDFLQLGFKYDNLLMEESAQILEIETFIPMLLQRQEDGYARLKRCILIGDHHQLPPVVKNMAFQKYSHMDQSLFTRFVRLGIPYIELNAQGRARPTIAELYNWRYRELGDLPYVREEAIFHKANSGFSYEYQLVDVPDYRGR
ncbi:hypothetical protein GUJ93_ZPchr0922g6512, partial [Zizania palustris]